MPAKEGQLTTLDQNDFPKETTPGRRKQRPLLLRILLDTNQLYNGSASDLLQLPLRKLIENSRSHQDITIEWILPDIVRLEREYQMISTAKQFLPMIGKLERLLGHNLALTEEMLSDRVRDAIDRQLRELAISTVELEVASIDWQSIVQAAIFRSPPFQQGEKEKGFRDALIAECFMRVIRESPKTPSTCRIAIVTADGLLAESMEARASDATNVRILRSLDDLQSLINTLVSNVTEEFVASVRDAAGTYFFDKQSKDGLYYKEKIGERLDQEFRVKLSEFPKTATSRENGTWYIGAPSFIEKKKQRIFWRTSIQVEATAIKLESRETVTLVPSSARITPQTGTLTFGGSTPFGPIGPSASRQIFATGLQLPELPNFMSLDPTQPISHYLNIPTERVVVAKGHTLFHVTWSVIITAKKKFSHPKIEELEWKETVWQ